MKSFKVMSLSQKRKILASTGLPMVALVLMMGFQNCSPGVVSSTKVASTGGTNNGPSQLDLDSDTKPVTVSYSENLLVSMQQQTGLQTLSARSITAANSAVQKVSETGKAESVNAPMWIAVTNLSSEVCVDLIAAEKAITTPASRRFFGQIDFTKGPTAITDAAKDDMIRRMARNFWSRNETVAEKIAIKSTLDAAMALPALSGQSTTAETDNALMFTCTAVLSALDSIRFASN